MLPEEVRAVLDGARQWSLTQGDCRDLLRTLPDNCIDSVIVDLPYELSNDGKASATRVALELLFPEDTDIKSEMASVDELPLLVSKILGLCGIDWKPGPSSAVPVVTVAFDGDATSRKNDVKDGDVSSRRVTHGNAGGDGEAEASEHIGSFFLEVADVSTALDALNCAGCGFSASWIGIGFRVTPTGLPTLFGESRVVDAGDPHVGVRDDALSQCVRALSGAEDLPVARLQLCRGAIDELSTHGALMFAAVLLAGGAKLVRTRAPASGLSSKLESRRIRIVHGPANGALTLDLVLHPVNVSSTGFMGKAWDGSKLAFDVDMWRQVLRVLKPGAHALSFGGTRTYHRMVCAMEDAGFIIRDQIDWLYGQGFPKNHNISKAIDRKAGAKREVVGQRILTGNAAQTTKEKGGTYASRTDSRGVAPKTVDVTAAATDDARAWEGWGSALKPGHEPIAMAMKPLDGTFEANVRKWGTGAINVDACRIGNAHISQHGRTCDHFGGAGFTTPELPGARSWVGRWPANVIFSHAPECELVGQRKVKAAPPWNDNRPASLFTGAETSPIHHSDGDGFETVDDWRCAPWCPVGMLDGQSGDRTSGSWNGRRSSSKHDGVFNSFQGTPIEAPREGNTGGASRFFTTLPYEPFFYEPKASQSERERGVEWMEEEQVGDGRKTPIDNPYQRGKTKRKNTHTTVKPSNVIRWCTRLITPVGRIALDMTAGSGTGGIAALAEGCRWIGFELLKKHCDIARARIIGDSPLFNMAGGTR